jgi:predicted RNA-binding Zn-ribbon protein involved in translation (DUF1610 family)
VSERVLKCPSCGAEIAFESAGTVVVVCAHCAHAIRRTDVALETIGKVAMPAELVSEFKLGTQGAFEGERFTVRGQVQLDHGAGPWNEWCAETTRGKWLWLAEAQGKVFVLRERGAGSPSVEPAGLHVGAEVRLDEGAAFVVSELGEGTVLAAAGELPITLTPGATTRYADLSRPGGFATLDWTRTPVEVFVGRAVTLDELALDARTTPAKRPSRAKGERVTCKHCGAAIALLDPQHAVTVACPACATLVDGRSAHLVARQAQEKLAKPAIRLGLTTRFRAKDVQVLGCLRRGVRYEGRLFPWNEYLLREADGEYSWLVENNGHWLHARPLEPGAVKLGPRYANHRSISFKHFDGGKAEVLSVLGEFYWEVRVGDKVDVADYVHGIEMLSSERDGKELSVSHSTHVPPEEVAAAFQCKLSARKGVGAVQPNPHPSGASWKLFLGAFGLLLLLHLAYRGRCDDAELATLYVTAPATTADARVDFSEPFEILERGENLHVELSVPSIVNGWVGVEGALVNELDGAVRDFALEAERYSGVSGGESWSEGSRSDDEWLGPLAPGRYRLRFSTAGFEGGLGHKARLRVVRDEPRLAYFGWAALLLFLVPIVTSLCALHFERKRWESSAHPWVEG